MPVGVISHHKCSLHDMGPHHPECPARMDAIRDRLISSGLEFAVRQFDAKPIGKSELKSVHSGDYVDSVFANAPEEGIYCLDEDTLMMPDTLEAALLSAGAAVQAVDLVMQGQLGSAFCATRPPGHHAERDKGMGFCFFNNIALAAQHAMDEYGLKRVAIVDFDVHHGNGTEDIFSGDERVLFCSTFQSPFYPFSGTQVTADNVINTPLDAGTGSDGFRSAVVRDWLPALNRFEPELMLISAGFDAHVEDDMSQVGLREADYLWVTQSIKKIAQRTCAGRVVSTLEGGYALEALGRCVVAHINGLLGDRI